ncbi:MAG: glycosyl hydrolase family 98 [Bacteroidaceae bacterium]|nr:glycosyl hydrolase family 98 [Bacteroidaceae bacterium]
MKRFIFALSFIICHLFISSAEAQLRRPIDNEHPLWMIHIDVWNAADPQKIIDLVPDDIKPWVCMNLSLSCQYDKENNVYKMPRSAVRTYKSWASVCQQNGLWFTCQPASGGRTHLQTNDLETFEYFFKHYPNFLGWNFAEQFWGFDDDDMGSATQVGQIALFANLVKMSHEYGGFLTISFCGNIWSHGLSPVGMMKRNSHLLQACRDYPEAILWLYKYTQPWCFYNAESVTLSPFISGLAKNYGVRYDRCGWCGAMDQAVGQNKAKYPIAAGIGTVMEQCGVNGGAVWDGPETIPDECFKETNRSTVNGYTRRNWTTYEGFRGAWIDMWRKVIDGTIYIPTRKEVVDSTRIVILANATSGSDEDKYATWGTLFDGLYKQNDPTNKNNGQWMDNNCYFKSTGRYRAIPLCVELYDSLAKTIPLKLKRTIAKSRWSTVSRKQTDFNKYYPMVSEGDLFVSRVQNQLVTYMPYTYLNSKRTATGRVPLLYNTCDSLTLTLGMLGSGIVREYADHIDFYLNNFRTDTTTVVAETIVIKGATAEPSYTMKTGLLATGTATAQWDAEASTYTLIVKHKGGVDVTVNCAGSNGRDSSNPSTLTTSPLPMPQQPAAYHGEIIIEAENMDYKNVKEIKLVNPYVNYFPDIVEFAGNGFVDMGTNSAGTLRHQLTLRDGEEGEYRISVRYTCTTKAGKMKATVNGKNSVLSIEKTDKNDWHKATFTATLKAGTNDFLLTNARALPMYIDQIIYTPADVEPERYQIFVRKADYGTVESQVTEATEGETVTLTVTPKEGYELKELRVINGVYYTMSKTLSIENGTLNIENESNKPQAAILKLQFAMPDDQVVLQPVFQKAAIPSAIQLVSADGTETTPIYDLRGQRYNNDRSLRPGIYIKNGKKILIK